ncbi:hypothetical protein AV650_26640 [Serratia fonticola]|nr:hypothetical protein AV650_26640 [Serratia fonticola]
MAIYIVTENNFFYLGVKEKLPFSPKDIRQLLPNVLENSDMDDFDKNDVFIFHTSNFGMAFSFQISTGNFPGKVIFIPTSRKEKFKLSFNQYVALDSYATIDDIVAKIISNDSEDSHAQKAAKDPLTRQEHAVMRHTIDGMDVHKIGQCLSISIKTVYAHRRNALHKLGGRNIFEIWPFSGKFLRDAVV